MSKSPHHTFTSPFGSAELELKQQEIFRRGLGSFPTKSATDLSGIRRVAQARAQLPDDAVINLPGTGLRLMARAIISNELLYYLMVGDYERPDLDLLTLAVRKKDRVVDAGGGVGVCAAWMASLAESKVVVIEARDDLAPYIHETLAINGLKGEVVHAALCDGGPDMVELGVGDNLWFSALALAGQQGLRTILAPRISLAEACEKFSPDVFLMDIEGAEALLDFSSMKKPPRELIIEIHTPTLGSQKTARIVQDVIDAGYKIRDIRSQTWWFSRRG